MDNLVGRVVAGALLACACLAGQAQPYPSKPIRLIVPFPAAGTADIAARTVAQALSLGLGQQIVVDNRGGADGAIAANAVTASPADGYTLFFATTTALNAAPTLRKPASEAVGESGSNGLRLGSSVASTRSRPSLI